MGTAIGIGRRARLNDYFVGSFLIGIGTSLPELFTSVAAVYSGSPVLVVPTVFGTVTANLGAGFGLGVLVLFFFVRAKNDRWYFFSRSHALSPGYLDFSQISKVTVILAALSVVLTLLLCLDGKFDRPDALLFAMLYAGFMGWEFYRSRNQDEHVASPPRRKVDPKKSPQSLQNKAILQIGLSAVMLSSLFSSSIREELHEIVAAEDIAFWCFIIGLILLLGIQIWDYSPELTRKGGPENTNVSKLHPSIAIPLLGFIIAVLYFSGVTVVGSLEKLSEDLRINSGILAASALALGTSLPDIVVALNVVRRGRHELLVGHIFQSNIFDAFLIMAVCGLIIRLPVATTGSAMISIIASVILTLPLLWILRSRKLTALGGLGLFAGLLAFLFLLYFME